MKIFKKMKIYVAGHNGMVGSSIVRKLKEKGYDSTMSLELFNEELWAQDPLEVITTGLERMRSLWAKA